MNASQQSSSFKILKLPFLSFDRWPVAQGLELSGGVGMPPFGDATVVPAYIPSGRSQKAFAKYTPGMRAPLIRVPISPRPSSNLRQS